MISSIFDIDNHGYVTEANVRKLISTNLFAARNIVKQFDWEAYDSAKKQQESAPEAEYVKALYDFTGSNDMELSFKEGAVMQLLQKVDTDWWWCDLDDKQGYVPANYVEPTKANVKTTKLSKFQTIKRGMEMDVLMFSLLKLANQGLGGKIPRDSFVQWALEHEMDFCFNVLEKFDLRVNKNVTTTAPVETPAPAPPTNAGSAPGTATVKLTTTTTTETKPTPEPVAEGIVVPETAMRSETAESASRISPELATVLRAAGIADKEMDDAAMAHFVSYFIDKHAPKVASGTTTAGRRKPRQSKTDDTVHRRPLPVPTTESTSTASTEAPAPSAPAAPAAPVTPTVIVTPSSDDVTAPSNVRISLHDQIKAGKKLRPSRKKTNLATLSKKDLTGLGLLLRVQIDSRRNFIAMSDEEGSSSDDEFD